MIMDILRGCLDFLIVAGFVYLLMFSTSSHAEPWPKVDFPAWQSVEIATIKEKQIERYYGSYDFIPKKRYPPVTPKRQCNKLAPDGSYIPYICGEGEK